MKTSHQLARELLELPDRPVHIDMWCGEGEPFAKLTDWNSEGDFVEAGEGDIIITFKS